MGGGGGGTKSNLGLLSATGMGSSKSGGGFLRTFLDLGDENGSDMPVLTLWLSSGEALASLAFGRVGKVFRRVLDALELKLPAFEASSIILNWSRGIDWCFIAKRATFFLLVMVAGGF